METKLGALCKRGHDDDGYGHSLRDRHGGCIACRKQRYLDNREEILEYNREYWRNLPKEKQREYSRQYRRRHPERIKVRRRAHYLRLKTFRRTHENVL